MRADNNNFIQCIDNFDLFDPIKNDSVSFGIEIGDFASPSLLDGAWKEHMQKYKDKLVGFKGVVSFHGTYLDLNPATPDPKIASITKERYMQSIEIAKHLDAKYIIFHSQIDPCIKEQKVKDIKNKRQLDFWDEILKEIEQDNITILLENFAENHPNDLLELIGSINNTKVKICLDIGHVLSNSKIGLDEWISVLKDEIAYIHCHWNDGSCDAHQPPSSEFMAYLSKLIRINNINPIIAFEYKIDNIINESVRIINAFNN